MSAASDAALVEAVLDGRADGLVRWERDVDADDVIGRLSGAGWHVVGLTTDEADGKETFLQACAAAFALPDWFGMNWDALDECLADLDAEDASGVAVLWTGWAELADADARTFAVAVDVLRDAAVRWQRDGTAAVVVLAGADGDGDAVGVPVLSGGKR